MLTRIVLVIVTLALPCGCAESASSSSPLPSSVHTESTPPDDRSLAKPVSVKAGNDTPSKQQTVELTKAAATKAQEFLQERGLPYLRVGVKGGGCMGFEYLLRMDDQFDANLDHRETSLGVQLVIDKRSAIFLQGTSIDFGIDNGKAGFLFDNPNAIKDTGEKKQTE